MAAWSEFKAGLAAGAAAIGQAVASIAGIGQALLAGSEEKALTTAESPATDDGAALKSNEATAPTAGEEAPAAAPSPAAAPAPPSAPAPAVKREADTSGGSLRGGSNWTKVKTEVKTLKVAFSTLSLRT